MDRAKTIVIAGGGFTSTTLARALDVADVFGMRSDVATSVPQAMEPARWRSRRKQIVACPTIWQATSQPILR